MTMPLLSKAPDGAARARGSVYVVDDEEAVRRSLALLLRLHGYDAAEFATAEEFLERAPAGRPACALVDVCLPGMSGLALQRRLAGAPHAPPVLLMTGHGDVAMARAALMGGASDFLEKPLDEQDLLAAVDVALRCDALRQETIREDARLLASLAMLSPEERELFDAITDGHQVRAIAQRRGVPVADVEARRARLMDKLEARRPAHLLRLRLRADACAQPREAGAAPGPASRQP
jgi:FixJ family two-component response regulator